MKKQIKYPSQNDCQVLIDIINTPTVHTGYARDEFKKIGDQFNTPPKGWTKLITKAFGTQSPWAIKYKKTRKTTAVLYWDKDKAKKLGL